MERGTMSKNYRNLAHCVVPALMALLGVSTRAIAFPLIFSSDRQAELVTCGCSVDQLGGLSRVPAALASKSVKGGRDRLWVDGGDLFFTSQGLSDDRLVKEKETARFLAKIYKQWGVQVMTPGPKDFAGGTDFFKEITKAAGIEPVSVNLRDEKGQLLFKPWTVVKRPGFQVAVIGVSGSGLFGLGSGVKVSDADAGLTEAFAAAKQAGANFFVVLSQSGIEEDKARAKKHPADIWLSGAAMDSLPDPLKVGGAQVMQLLPQGQQLGVFHVEAKQAVRFESINVVHELKEDKAIQRAVDSLKKKQRSADSAVPAGKVTKPLFVANVDTCRGCHAKQVEFWEGTDHASAYLVLYAKNQHFDRDCIGCHTLGFEKDPAYSKIAHPFVLKDKALDVGDPFVEKLMNKVFARAGIAKATESAISPRDKRAEYAKVKRAYHDELGELRKVNMLERNYLGVQCEHCHGNRTGHPAVKAKVKKVSETSCRECHRGPNAPAFSPKMVPKVACPAL